MMMFVRFIDIQYIIAGDNNEQDSQAKSTYGYPKQKCGIANSKFKNIHKTQIDTQTQKLKTDAARHGYKIV